MRDEQRQISPWLRNALRVISGTATPRSASSQTTAAFLPPSSSDAGIKRSPQRAASRRPVTVPPVKLTARTAGQSTIACPASGPSPCTMLSTPAGSPAARAISPSTAAVVGVSSLGFAITQFPAASAGAIFQVKR